MEKKPLKVLDLFSGIGGFSLGLERAGMETVAFCEINPEARKVLQKHWPDTKIFNNIKDLQAPGLTVDVICGGFPCQDLSIANIGGDGLQGTRSGLWYEYLRLIQELEPTYVIIENVANLRSKGLASILKDLWEVGYDTEWHIIPASSVGLPHLRERIWIIAYPTSLSVQECLLKRGELFTEEPQKPRFGDGWLSQWLSSWIRSEVLSEGDGLPRPLACDAVRQYGNSVVPQIPEAIGKTIMEHFNRL